MSTDKLGENKFDEMLGQALKRHSESVPVDFTNRMLRQIRYAQQQRILARVILQQRLALAACIVFSGIAIVVATIFPDIAAAAFRNLAIGLTQQGQTLINRIPQAIRAFSSEWQSYTILGAVSGFAAYSLVELFIGDRVTIA